MDLDMRYQSIPVQLESMDVDDEKNIAPNVQEWLPSWNWAI